MTRCDAPHLEFKTMAARRNHDAAQEALEKIKGPDRMNVIADLLKTNLPPKKEDPTDGS